MDTKRSRRFVGFALILLALIWMLRLTATHGLGTKAKQTASGIMQSLRYGSDATAELNLVDMPRPLEIVDRVAILTETRYSSRLLPLIMHFSGVLGPAWPVLLFTTQAVMDEHLATSAIWRHAAATGRVEARVIADEFNLTTRHGVNVYLTKPWLWQQLLPAKRVLVFQTDAMVCANSGRDVDEFFEWDIVGAHMVNHLFNGGLSLRNLTMMLEIIDEGNDWDEEVKSGHWSNEHGEDVYFSQRMFERGGHMPDRNIGLQFAVMYPPDAEQSKKPFGYHNVQKLVKDKMDEITEWCPEIQLAAAGKLSF